MPITTCNTCGGDYRWDWEEAFDKFGFGDGDGQIETDRVIDVLTEAGYQVEFGETGLHNTFIDKIADANGVTLYEADREFSRDVLPAEILKLLDEKLPANGRLDK
ncbi:hypothetical protein [Hyphomicrobium sp. CS1BSMeth3]|uniref:hypothetical protein n=1 Tax=Hyphomicrobium sp. CS1BSMeth3 TaxID=1892844 RepID=UPI0009306B65|nr:hypothetical protein [Hyphomicrobium sp. CS1BSMeth3]